MSNARISRLLYIPRYHIIVISIILFFSLLVMYSTSQDKCFTLINQSIRILVSLVVMLVACVIDTWFWRKYSIQIYTFCIVLLLFVTVVGKTAMGAKRWLSLPFISFQPSELVKIALVFVLSSYYANKSDDFVRKTSSLIVPLLLSVIPTIIVCKQPDLGTAMLLVLIVISILFFVNVQIWKFIAVLVAAVIVSPILWSRLHQYQKKRILTFLNPEIDALGSGYHILQSKIALGSGGMCGNTLKYVPQCNLNFLPEKQTDFIFAAIGEQFGMFGCITLILLYILLLTGNFVILFSLKDKFQRIMVFAFNAIIFFYASINILMVCGLLPVVGIPLPLCSYGGTSLSTLLFCQGVIFSCYINKFVKKKCPDL